MDVCHSTCTPHVAHSLVLIVKLVHIWCGGSVAKHCSDLLSAVISKICDNLPLARALCYDGFWACLLHGTQLEQLQAQPPIVTAQ